MCNLLCERGKELGYSSDGHSRCQPRLDAPDPALVIEVSGQRGQGGRGSTVGHHSEGAGHRGMLQVENEGGSIVRRQLLIPRRGQKCGLLRWKEWSARGCSCLDSQPTCWAWGRDPQQQNMVSPAQDPVQTAVTKFTSASYQLGDYGCHSQPRNPNPPQQAAASQHTPPAAGSTSTDPPLSNLPGQRGCADSPDLHHYLMSSFSKGLCSTTRHGLSESADWAPATGGDLEGELLPNIFLFAFGVASLLWTLWGKRSCKIRSRNSSTICYGKSKR